MYKSKHTPCFLASLLPLIAHTLPPTSIIQLFSHHVLVSTRLPRRNLSLKNIQIARPAWRQIPRRGIDQRPYASQASSITVSISNHTGVLLKEFDNFGNKTIDDVLLARTPIRTLVIHARELGDPDRLPILGPVVSHIILYAIGRVLVRMDAGVVPRWLRHPESLHKRREPSFVQLRSHGGRPDEGIAHFSEGGLPGGGGGGRVHIARVWGWPVRFVEAHHVCRGRRGW